MFSIYYRVSTNGLLQKWGQIYPTFEAALAEAQNTRTWGNTTAHNRYTRYIVPVRAVAVIEHDLMVTDHRGEFVE